MDRRSEGVALSDEQVESLQELRVTNERDCTVFWLFLELAESSLFSAILLMLLIDEPFES